MLRNLTFSNALPGNEATGSELLCQAVIDETGFKAMGAVNAISYVLWSVWLIAFGAALLLRKGLG